MKIKYLKKLISLIMISIILLSNFQVSSYAIEKGDSAKLKSIGNCNRNVEFKFDSGWSTIKCDYIAYIDGDNTYPAYCIRHGYDGVEDIGSYKVNLTKILDDERLYRVIINGYPYKTPSQLGVADKYDAYMATKQAINCVMLGRDVGSMYRGLNSAGDNVVKAIKKLVNIGRNGTQTFETPNLKVEKVGSFKESGNYYVQEYKVESDIQISTYKIQATANLPTGAFIADTSNNSKTSFKSGENFRLVVPKSSLTSDISKVVINVKSKCKTYPVFFGKTTVSSAQNYAITCDPYGDYDASTTFTLKTNTGKIKIIKNDSETNKPIEGVTFKLSKKDGTVIANATTDKNGEATFSSLYQGTYVLKEIATNDNYILNESSFDVDVEYDKTSTKTITNDHKKGDIKIYKIDKDNNRVVLGNVEFNLYSEEFGKVIGTYTTDVNGELEIKNLRTGNYKLIETKTNKWYNLAEDTDIKVNWDEKTTKDIENELKKGQVRIIKVDKDNNETKLEGVEFEVLNENNDVLEKVITNENGEALTSKYAIRDFSKLKIRETNTLDNYVLSDEIKTIELQENQITNVTFENERIKGKLQITKVDSKDENKKLEGATFGLYDENNNLIETLKTKEDGTAISKDLYKGKYYLKELDTGSNYYLLNEDIFEFEIVNNGEIIKQTIKNEPTDITVDVNKEGTTEIKPGEDVNYTFSNVANNSNVYLDSFNWYDYIPTDYIRLQKMTTGTWNQDLTYKVYYKTNKSNEYVLFKEDLQTNQNYDLDFTLVELKKDEYIIETMFDFGKVEKGFKEICSPTMNCKSFDTLQENDTFTNFTKTVGTYFGVTAEANSKWTTITHVPEEKHETLLPRTGK